MTQSFVLGMALVLVGASLTYLRARVRRTERRWQARPVPCGCCGEVFTEHDLVHGLCTSCWAQRFIRRCAECEQPLPARYPADWTSCTSCMAPRVVVAYRAHTAGPDDLAITRLLRDVPRVWDRF